MDAADNFNSGPDAFYVSGWTDACTPGISWDGRRQLSGRADSRWSGVLATTEDPLVSSDIVGDSHAAIVDLSLTKVIDSDLCAVYSWYGNEFGFANTDLAHVLKAAETLHAAHSSVPVTVGRFLAIAHRS